MAGDIHERLDREQKRLDQLRKDEDEAYYKFNQARQARDIQEREVSYLFGKLIDRVSQS